MSCCRFLSKAAKEHKIIFFLEKSKPTNSRTKQANDIEILTEVCSSNHKYLLKVWFQLFVPFLSEFAKEHQNIKYILKTKANNSRTKEGTTLKFCLTLARVFQRIC